MLTSMFYLFRYVDADHLLEANELIPRDFLNSKYFAVVLLFLVIFRIDRLVILV